MNGMNVSSMKISDALSLIQMRLIYGLCTTGIGVVGTYLASAEAIPKHWSITIAILYVVALTVVLLAYQRRKIKIEEGYLREKERGDKAEEEVKKLKEEKKTRDMRLVESSLDEIVDLLKERLSSLDCIDNKIEDILEAGKGMNEKREEIINLLSSPEFKADSIRRDMVIKALEKLCEIFKRDSYASETMAYPLGYFKATIFEPVKINSKVCLIRTHEKYPPGVEPITQSIDPSGHQTATAVRCWKSEQMVLVEDVLREWERKHISERRWNNIRTDHVKDYKSIVCVHIAKGIPGKPSRKIIGILSIDTNREKYFREDREYEAFLGYILLPFRLLISLFYEMERNQNLLTRMLKELR